MSDRNTSPGTDERLTLLRTMMLIRGVDHAWADAYFAEEIGGIPPSLSTGQEAVSAGACAALEPGDVVFTTHRGQAPQVARGLAPARILAELYCRRTGYNKGKSYHVTDVSRGVIGMGGVVPAQVPVAGGMALALKLRNTDRVSLALFGDGASNEGAVHETANLAAMWTLPLILLCENNGYCITQPVSDAVKAPSIASRAAGYGLPGVVVDGNDVNAVHAASAEAVAPTLVEVRDRFRARLADSESRANDVLDDILSQLDERRVPIVKIALDLPGREIASSEQLAAILREIEERVAAHLERGARVRLI